MGFYLNKKFTDNKLKMRSILMIHLLLLMIYLFVSDGVPIADPPSCFTCCHGQQLGSSPMTSQQASQLQGPRGKQGPNGLTGMKGEKGEAGAFHSDAEALALLTTKYDNLFNITMKLKFQLTYYMANSVPSTATPVTATTPEATTPLTTTTTPECSVRTAGIEDSAIIEDRQLTASSQYPHGYYEPRVGRLHSTTGYGWLMSYPYRVGEWLQVDLESNRRIFGVATQARRGYSDHVTTYVITYKRDGKPSFQTYTDDKGNA